SPAPRGAGGYSRPVPACRHRCSGPVRSTTRVWLLPRRPSSTYAAQVEQPPQHHVVQARKPLARVRVGLLLPVALPDVVDPVPGGRPSVKPLPELLLVPGQPQQRAHVVPLAGRG